MRRLILILLILNPLTLTIASDNVTRDDSDSANPGSRIPSSPLVIVSWNMQWLSVAKKNTVITRAAGDYKQLARIITTISPDILAFQEVDSVEAIQAILPDSKYRIYLSDRHKKSDEIFQANNQFTGFAVKRSLPVVDPPDLSTLNIRLRKQQKHNHLPGKLRYGSYLIIKPEANSELHLLNVHLKSGCFSRRYNRASLACRTLNRQATALVHWIRQRQTNDENYIVLGDFNHQLNSGKQWLLTALNVKLAFPIVSITKGMAASCRVKHTLSNGATQLRHYRTSIDHALSSETLTKAIRQRGQIYQYQDSISNITKFQLSDHCPLVLRLPSKLL